MTEQDSREAVQDTGPAEGASEDASEDAATFDGEYVRKLRQENARWRKEVRELQEKQGDVEALQAQVRRSAIQAAVIAAAARAGIADPEDAVRLADLEGVEIDEDGTVSGADEAVAALVEAKPYLRGEQAGPTPGVRPLKPGDEGPPGGPSRRIRDLTGVQGTPKGADVFRGGGVQYAGDRE